MPRPPQLPVLDWASIFAKGKSYQDWLAHAESPEHRAKMEQEYDRVKLSAGELAFLGALPRPLHVVAIAEDWCGDVVRHAPVLARIAAAAPQLRLAFIARDAAPEAFVRFLTNGGEAIPKFVFLSDKFVECGSWGPMPEFHRKLIARGKALGDVGLARKRVSALYDADEFRRDVVRELIELVDIATTTII